MVQLRIYTYTTLGVEYFVEWSFEPLEGGFGELTLDQSRENQTAAWGKLMRRPFDERERRTLTIGAGVLRDPLNWQRFRSLCYAHKVTWLREINDVSVWVEFVPDIPEEIKFDLVEDIPFLRRFKFDLVQAAPLVFTDFNNDQKRFSDQ